MVTDIVQVPVIKKALHIGRINPKGPKNKFLMVEIIAACLGKGQFFVYAD